MLDGKWNKSLPGDTPLISKGAAGRVARLGMALIGATSLVSVALSSAAYAQSAKPNILFIMGDDIGWMQPSIYHRGPDGRARRPTSTASATKARSS